MTTRTAPATTTHYIVTLNGSTDRVSVWGLDEFRALQAAKRITKVHAVTPQALGYGHTPDGCGVCATLPAYLVARHNH